MLGRIHVIGAGLAGLSAALDLAEAGQAVTLYEAGPACGGRARSYDDRQLGCRIDNGNHLLLSANHATFGFLERTAALDTLAGPRAPIFPFVDLRAGLHWTLRLSAGRVPWWVLRARTRIPEMRLGELRSLWRLLRARPGTTVAECLLPGMLTERLLGPLSISVLNTQPERGSASLMAAMMRESLVKGGAACVPWFAAVGLSESLIDPALARLRALGVVIRTNCRVAGMGASRGRLTQLLLPEGDFSLGASDSVILAVPAPVASELAKPLLPELTCPEEFESIVNLHYRASLAGALQGTLAQAGFVGIVGGAAEWAFIRPDIVSVTISAANKLAQTANETLAEEVWDEVRRALTPWLRPGGAIPPSLPDYRVIREKRATFAATAVQEKLRPGSRTRLQNLFLAGDWVATGLPATIEGAIRSGSTAASLLVRS